MGGEGILAQQKNQMKRFNTITAATAVIGSIVSIGIMQRPVMARCGDGLVPDPNGGNFCVPESSSDSDAIFRLCSSRVEYYRKISIESGWSNRMDPVASMKRCMDSKGRSI